MTEKCAGRVVVIDDDVDVRESLKLMLELAGYHVATYASGRAFLDDRGSRAACLILDHHMPGMSGLELTAHLSAVGVRLPVLLITGRLTAGISRRAAALGVAKVLEKPFREDEILRFIVASGAS